ncbi:MAG: RNA methyltransferase [Micrococcales bacterium]|nr:RNA methyltransferase [Micrococcales bacterium]
MRLDAAAVRRPNASDASPALTNVKAERVRAVAALGRRSARERRGLFVAEGPQAVREAVACRPGDVREIFADSDGQGRHHEILRAARDAGIAVRATSGEVLAAMCSTTTPQGLLAVCRRVDVPLDSILAGTPRLLVVLTSVRDPGNAGTVIRGADAAGADAVIIGSASVDLYNPKVVRSAVGSHFHLPIAVRVDIPALLTRLGELSIATYATDGSGPRTVYEVDLSAPHAWVMGNEAWGMPESVLSACDEVVGVPLYGRAESLNLAMAATVCLFASARALHGPRAG